MKLLEEQYYRFKVVKTVTLPDTTENMILMGPDGRKYLLPLTYYKDYDLKDKTEITCRVDKINCRGKVFLEPENPWFSPGDKIEATVNKIEFDEAEKVFIVEVSIMNSFNLRIRMNRRPEESVIRCSVVRIRKGQPVLIPNEEE